MKVLHFYWHIHHLVLLEPATEPIAARRKFIRQYKKPPEGVELRLRLLKRVRGKLPEAVLAAGTACVKAWAARDKAWAALEKAWAARDKAWAAHDKALADHDKAWAAHDKARAARDKAWAAHDKAWAAHDKAWAACDKALADHRAEIDALHAVECPDCPWDGETIFPEVAA